MLLNGAPGARLLLDGHVDTVVGFAFENGRISRIFTVRNPAKLGRIAEETALAR
jgi:RNA polymerase sigma-70 factor (ECF subfamily)